MNRKNALPGSERPAMWYWWAPYLDRPGHRYNHREAGGKRWHRETNSPVAPDGHYSVKLGRGWVDFTINWQLVHVGRLRGRYVWPRDRQEKVS